MLNFIAQYGIETAFGLIAGVIGIALKSIHKKIKYQAKKSELVEKGVQALLRDRIIQSYNHYIDKGYCPIYALDNIDEMYSKYHDLGGNGTVTKLYNELKELPTERKS